MEQSQSHDAGGMLLPGWFVKLAGAVMAGAIPWAFWMSMLVHELNIKLEALAAQSVTVSSNTERITRLEERIRALEFSVKKQ